MQLFYNPSPDSWPAIIERPVMALQEVYGKVRPVMQQVKADGDEALKALTARFDGVDLETILVTPADVDLAVAALPQSLKTAIDTAAANIRLFHAGQLALPAKIETMPGVLCWRKNAPIEKVGIYIPGGTAPLFSTVLMLAIPAQIAGCRQVVLCTPPQKNGDVHPAVLYAARITGVTTVAKVGGAQAIAAMAYGTASVPKVYKIFGPGNQFVTAAKQLVQQDGLAIDMPAGPSEVCVVADATANPAYVAADLLSQAEHGADSQVLLVATPGFDMAALQAQLESQLNALPRKDLAAQALAQSRAVVLDNPDDMLSLVNAYAPEHLIIAMENAEDFSAGVFNAGSIFLGHYTPESVGDYASGTNHTLPTNGYAAMYSGVSVDSFVKKITVQQLTPDGLKNIASTVVEMAEAEGLQAHARAVSIRLQQAPQL